MPEKKGPFLISLVVAVAFIWGYKREMIAEWWNSPAKEPVAAPAPQQEEPKEAEPTPANSVGITPTNSRLPQNPYETFMIQQGKKAKANNPKSKESLSDTLNSIRRNKIDDKQIRQRNLYFERLSQQLNELRGGQQQKPTPKGGAASNTTGLGRAKNTTNPFPNINQGGTTKIVQPPQLVPDYPPPSDPPLENFPEETEPAVAELDPEADAATEEALAVAEEIVIENEIEQLLVEEEPLNVGRR